MSAPETTERNAQPPAKRVKKSYVNHITVLVGPQEQHFVAHEGIITNHSKFFAAACKGEFREAKERLVRLPEEDPELFNSYLHWIYTREVLTPAECIYIQAIQENREEDEELVLQTASPQFTDLARFYVMADRLDDRDLRNAIIDATLQLRATRAVNPAVRAILTAYADTAETSKFRALILDCHAHYVQVEWLNAMRPWLPADFIFGLACSKGKDTEMPCWENRCKYHEHDEETPNCT